MDNLCLFGIFIESIGNTVIETHTTCDQYITFICQKIWSVISMHTKHANSEWMISWNCTHAHDRPCSRNACFLNKFLKFFFCFSKYHTLSKYYKWFFGFIYQLRCLFNIFFAHNWLWTIASYMLTLFISIVIE